MAKSKRHKICNLESILDCKIPCRGIPVELWLFNKHHESFTSFSESCPTLASIPELLSFLVVLLICILDYTPNTALGLWVAWVLPIGCHRIHVALFDNLNDSKGGKLNPCHFALEFDARFSSWKASKTLYIWIYWFFLCSFLWTIAWLHSVELIWAKPESFPALIIIRV